LNIVAAITQPSNCELGKALISIASADDPDRDRWGIVLQHIALQHMEIKMKKFPSTVRLIPAVTALTIGLFATAATAQHYLQGEPGEAPGVSQDGPGKPLPVDPAEVRRDNTAGPGEAPLASTTGGRPQPVDPAELRRDNTANPGSLPTARR